MTSGCCFTVQCGAIKLDKTRSYVFNRTEVSVDRRRTSCTVTELFLIVKVVGCFPLDGIQHIRA